MTNRLIAPNHFNPSFDDFLFFFLFLAKQHRADHTLERLPDAWQRRQPPPPPLHLPSPPAICLPFSLLYLPRDTPRFDD